MSTSFSGLNFPFSPTFSGLHEVLQIRISNLFPHSDLSREQVKWKVSVEVEYWVSQLANSTRNSLLQFSNCKAGSFCTRILFVILLEMIFRLKYINRSFNPIRRHCMVAIYLVTSQRFRWLTNIRKT